MELENFLSQSNCKNDRTKSLIKWAGGKGRVLKSLSPYLLSDNFYGKNRFIEPFCGSMTVSLFINHPCMLLNDKNRNLINFFEQVKSNPLKLHKKIDKLKNEYNGLNKELKSKFYYDIRDRYNKQYIVSGNGITNASYFWFLNKTGFNGMYRETKDGKFNIPFGERDCPDIDFEHINEVALIIENAALSSLNFDSFCNCVTEGDAIYLDPPYLPYSETSNFNSYLGKGFDVELHIKLATIMKRLSRKGVSVLMSNSKSLLTEEIYGKLKGFNMESIMVSRSISAKSESRKKAGELIMANFKP